METNYERSRSRLHLVPPQQGSSSTWVPQTRYASPQASHGRNNHCSPLTGFLEAGGPMVFQDRLRQVVPARFAVVCHAHQAIAPRVRSRVIWASRTPGPRLKACGRQIILETDHWVPTTGTPGLPGRSASWS